MQVQLKKVALIMILFSLRFIFIIIPKDYPADSQLNFHSNKTSEPKILIRNLLCLRKLLQKFCMNRPTDKQGVKIDLIRK